MMGPEDEDQIPMHDNFMNDLNIEDQADQFLELFMINVPNVQKMSMCMGQTDIEMSDNLIRKVYESILHDMPESSVSKYREAQMKLEEKMHHGEP